MTNKAKLLFLNHSVDVLIIDYDTHGTSRSKDKMMALYLTCDANEQYKIAEGLINCSNVELYYDNSIEKDFYIEHFIVNKSKMFVAIRQVRKIKNLDFKVVFDAN